MGAAVPKTENTNGVNVSLECGRGLPCVPLEAGMAPAEYSRGGGGGGVQLGEKHQEDPHTAPKALWQGSGGRAPMWGV